MGPCMDCYNGKHGICKADEECTCKECHPLSQSCPICKFQTLPHGEDWCLKFKTCPDVRACAEYEVGPRCHWGAAYEDTHCHNIAIWFDPEFATYGSLCDEHYARAQESGWARHMVRAGEKGGPVQKSIRNFWITDKKSTAGNGENRP
jgi:hypothetical protein